MTASIQGASSGFLELQQLADHLASIEDPTAEQVQSLYNTVIELSQQGATQAEIALLDRGIAAIQEEDEAEDVPAAAPSPAPQKSRHHHHRRHGLKKVAHNIGKFFRKHKKEILIGGRRLLDPR